MQRLKNEITKVLSHKDNNRVIPILRDVNNEDWELIASLTHTIKDDFKSSPHLTELRSKIRAGIYHVDKELIVDKLIQKFFSDLE